MVTWNQNRSEAHFTNTSIIDGLRKGIKKQSATNVILEAVSEYWKVEKMRVYGIIWNDNTKKFGEPIPIKKEEISLYKFPDAIIYAKNKEQAKYGVKQINWTYSKTDRENIPSIFEVKETQ